MFKSIFRKKSKQIKQSDNVKSEEDKLKKFNSIYPYFKKVELQKKVNERNNENASLPPNLELVSENICEDMNCFYIYDNELGFEFIQKSELNDLNISKENLHEIAMVNYRKLISEKLNVQSNTEAYWFLLDGNLEASLVLVDEIWDQIEEKLNENIVICVPSRDVIIATGVTRTKVIKDFSLKAQEILKGGDHLVSENWFIRKNKEWHFFKKINE